MVFRSTVFGSDLVAAFQIWRSNDEDFLGLGGSGELCFFYGGPLLEKHPTYLFLNFLVTVFELVCRSREVYLRQR